VFFQGVSKLFAFDLCESEMKIPTLQISVGDLRDIVPPENESRSILIIPGLFRFILLSSLSRDILLNSPLLNNNE
jgi:hypothetical protein